MIEYTFEALAIFFNYAKCIVNNEADVQLIDNMVASKLASNRKKIEFEPRQNRGKVDDVNAINTSVDAYICTIRMHVCTEHKQCMQTHMEGQWSHIVEVKSCESFIRYQFGQPLESHTWTDVHTYMLHTYVYQCDSDLHKIYIKGKNTLPTHAHYTYTGMKWQLHRNIHKWNDKHAENPS